MCDANFWKPHTQTMGSLDAPAAAAAFAAARTSATTLFALPESFPANATEADGYAVLNALEAEPGALGPRIGWKVGATNAQAQASLGFSSPFYGPLFASARIADGAGVSLASLGARLVAAEAEFAFALGAALPPRDAEYTEDEVWAATASFHPAIELAACRVTGVPATPASVLADSAWNGAFVIGAPVACSSIQPGSIFKDKLHAATAALSVNGDEKAAGAGSGVLGSPLTSLTWLANALRSAGRGLAAGDVVLTGAAALHRTLAPGDCVSASFVGVGADPLAVTVRIT